MSYGRSSLIVTLAWVGLLLRVYHEALWRTWLATVRQRRACWVIDKLRAHRHGAREGDMFAHDEGAE